MPEWRNGRRSSLKSCRGQPHGGSSPFSGTLAMNRDMHFEWSPKLAYIVGLIATDGSLSKDKRHVDFTSMDVQLLKTFKDCLVLKNRICVKSNYQNPNKKYFHLQFGHVKFYKWLLSLGLMPNKTGRLGKIKIPNRYFKDFLRGHMDRDGSIFTYNDRYMSYKGKRYSYNRLYSVFNSTSFAHLK